MNRGIFGWSYPPGCSGPPDDDYEFHSLRCKHCKSFIGGIPARVEHWENGHDCNGEDCDGLCGGPSGKHAPHKEIWDAGTTQVFVCKRCKKETKIG